MSGYLIDTNVLSEYNRPAGPNPGLQRWLETTERRSQYVSVITLAEIQKGIELLAVGQRRSQLEHWLKEDLEAWFAGSRVLDIDRQVALWRQPASRSAESKPHAPPRRLRESGSWSCQSAHHAHNVFRVLTFRVD